MLKPLLLLPAVLVLAYFPAKAGTPAPQKTNAATTSAADKTPGISAKVKQIYKIDCEMCHAENGNGKTELGQSMGVTSDFSDPKFLDGKSDQQLFDAIRKGKDKMPPEDAPRATDDQIRGLVQYLRTLSKGQPTPPAEPAPAAPATASTSPTAN